MRAKTNLYRQQFVRDLGGYTVYRDLVSDPSIDKTLVAVAHKVAVFVSELEAEDYCEYRNRLLVRTGSDELPVRT